MKAVLIDSTAQAVTDIELKPGLPAMYKAIGCRIVEKITLDEKHDLWFDEEGLLHDPQPPAFLLSGYNRPFVGNALICGYTSTGRTLNSRFNAREIRFCIAFLGSIVIRIPEPVCIDLPMITPTPDADPETKQPDPCGYCGHVGLPVLIADHWPFCAWCGGI